MGLKVIEAAHAIPTNTRLDNVHFINHGSIALVSKPGINIAKVETKIKPETFEHVCCRVSGGFTPILLVAIYWLSSQQVSDQFFKEISILLEALATFNCETLVAGDIDIHFEQQADADSWKFTQLFKVHKLHQIVSELTHDYGGLLYVVLTSADETPEDVAVSESRLSDHKVIHWTISTVLPSPIYKKVNRRRWSLFNVEEFKTKIKAFPPKIKAFPPCQPVDLNSSATDLASCYH